MPIHFWRLFIAAMLAGFTVGCSISVVANENPEQAGIVEIYEQWGDNKRLDALPPEAMPIVLQIPDKFRYGSSAHAIQTWGMNLLTYYPSFTSPADPENREFGLNCTGYCNGRILISIENRTHSLSDISPNMGDFIARVTIKWEKDFPRQKFLQNIHISELPPEAGFDEGFEQIATEMKDAPEIIPGHPTTIQRFYFRKAALSAGYFDLTATCMISTQVPSCILHFSLTCNPAIYVTVNGVEYKLLDKFAHIRDKADRFVSSMVQNPPCHQ